MRRQAPEIRWIPTDHLAAQGSTVLKGSSGVWCAPGSPFKSLDGALEGIRWARESRTPFLGTCAGFQHGVLEYARNVLGNESASHAEYGPSGEDEMFIEELLCSLVGQTMEVEVVDGELLAAYGDRSPKERYYCRFGLNPKWRSPLEEAGLVVAGVDAEDGDVRVMRLDKHPFFYLTLFRSPDIIIAGSAAPAHCSFPRVRPHVTSALGHEAGHHGHQIRNDATECSESGGGAL